MYNKIKPEIIHKPAKFVIYFRSRKSIFLTQLDTK